MPYRTNALPTPAPWRPVDWTRVAIVVLAAWFALGCTPPAPVDGGVAVTPSGWTSTARVVLDTLRWAVPAARAITDA